MVDEENLIMVIEPAVTPISRLSPKKFNSLMTTIILSSILGISIVFLKDNYNLFKKKYI